MKRLTALAFALAATLAAVPAFAQDTLAKIKEKGVLTVGVKNDYKPWGFLDPSGKIVGLEIDLAQEVADKIGVKLEMVPVIAANRIEFLRQGRIDMILATLGDTQDRRKQIGMIEPNYYAGATNVLAPKSAGLKKWEDLKGRKVCAVQGAYYNRRVSQIYAPEMVVFPSVPDGLNALLGNNCVAFLFDDTLIVSTLSGGDPKWANYEMPLTSEDPQLWAIGVRLDDLDGPFGKLVKEMSVDWHKSGKLLALETKWGIKQSPYLIETNKKLKAGS
ncbi:transporter substrate-binding domain-containing protein [Bosea sp. BK604]|uniref:transporter substrate-binding domain-containing protein n=1 Tax=Bosea sp. BK604 TaxID=2512180 RepID=UPI0010441662|nr:transporter substrate-binding domain-containing protein [Bosea sp. BK604]TCR66451.1 amino acid ABC transporter substrate-binding protein (PAAT family) [Bosea sp. BK604]